MSTINIWLLVFFLLGLFLAVLGYEVSNKPGDDFGSVVWAMLGVVIMLIDLIAAACRLAYLYFTGGL